MSERMESLDGLRGIAALSVVVQHFTTDTKWYADFFLFAGSVGVALFFVLSGFLMGHLYGGASFSAPAVVAFWLKRIGRVVPLYLVCVFTAYGYFELTGTNRPMFTVTWDMFWQHLLFIDAQSLMWTIPREMQFYAVFPLIWLGLTLHRGATSLALCAALVVLAIFHYESPYVVLFRSAHFFIIGVLASLIRIDRDQIYDVPFVILMFGYFISWPGVLDAIGLTGAHGNVWSSPIYLVLLPALVVAAVNSPLASRVLGCMPLTYVGTISYSVYLLHAPVFWTLFMFTPLANWPRPLLFLVDLLVVGIAASASYYYFESPLRRWVGDLRSADAVHDAGYSLRAGKCAGSAIDKP